MYEIDEAHAPALARALIVSVSGSAQGVAKGNEGGDDKAKEPMVSSLLSPCVSAVVSVFEMDDYGDCLSRNSVGFLFPILHATLMGPRNIPRCDC